MYKNLPLLLSMLCASLMWPSAMSQAHQIQNPRVIHIILGKKQIEVYVNLLLPTTPHMELWHQLFDRNRNRQLDADELLELGKYLAHQYVAKINLQLNGKTLTWRLTEVENSKLRGDHRSQRYAWDYRLSASAETLAEQEYTLQIKLPLLFDDEQIPVALIPMTSQILLRTKSSYVLHRPNASRAICRIDKKQTSCLFHWKKPQASTQPNQRNAQ